MGIVPLTKPIAIDAPPEGLEQFHRRRIAAFAFLSVIPTGNLLLLLLFLLHFNRKTALKALAKAYAVQTWCGSFAIIIEVGTYPLSFAGKLGCPTPFRGQRAWQTNNHTASFK